MIYKTVKIWRLCALKRTHFMLHWVFMILNLCVASTSWVLNVVILSKIQCVGAWFSRNHVLFPRKEIIFLLLNSLYLVSVLGWALFIWDARGGLSIQRKVQFRVSALFASKLAKINVLEVIALILSFRATARMNTYFSLYYFSIFSQHKIGICNLHKKNFHQGRYYYARLIF